jgi:hypothetical protein
MGGYHRDSQARAWQVAELLKGLSEEEKARINKLYPLRDERDEAICKLKIRGVTFDVLAKITGISESQLKRIAEKHGLTKVRRKRKTA